MRIYKYMKEIQYIVTLKLSMFPSEEVQKSLSPYIERELVINFFSGLCNANFSSTIPT